jgi:hypothetical protein
MRSGLWKLLSHSKRAYSVPTKTKKFSEAQIAALAHPLDGKSAIDPACYSRSAADAINGILTCDVDAETARAYGGPVWHASVCPPFRHYAETLLSGVGEGARFDDAGLLYPDVYHLRRRMTLEEISRLGSLAGCGKTGLAEQFCSSGVRCSGA